MPSSDLLLPELLLNNQFVPLLQTINLTEYQIKRVSFSNLCEFRSKMGFKFKKITYAPADPKTINLQTAPQSGALESIEYRYFVDMHIQIQCILEPTPVLPNNNNSSRNNKNNTTSCNIMIRNKLIAPQSTLKVLARKQSDLYARLHRFVESIYKKDLHFSVLEEIVQML